jgi:nucleotide-binding universal stress UspA family protein
MNNKILVAIDGSDGGKRALEAAVNQAKLTQSGLVLTYIIDWTPYSFHTPEELAERKQRRDSDIQSANDLIINPEVERLKDSGLEVETVVRHGKIAEALNEIATEHQASQVYIGKLGESRMRSMIFGSVTAALIQTSTLPVTVVP